MRGRVLFACLFVAALWLLLRAYGRAVPAKAAELPVQAVALQAPADLPEEAPRAPAAPPARPDGEEAPRFVPRAAASPRLCLPFYRAAWQAFHREGGAG